MLIKRLQNMTQNCVSHVIMCRKVLKQHSSMSAWKQFLLVTFLLHLPIGTSSVLFVLQSRVRNLYTVFRKKTPTHIFFHICMSDM